MTFLHESLSTHRVDLQQRVWPSLVAVSSLAFVHVVTYWMGNFIVFSRVDALEGTAYGQPAFVFGSIFAALLLVPFVIYDVRRHDQVFWRGSRYIVGAMLLAVLLGLLRLLWSAAALL
ncbi:MAG: hypothetical protein GKS06_10360 [Acidobacteria bacterium]|nr:hypothetical protein [Acidobacteriota bacterium]